MEMTMPVRETAGPIELEDALSLLGRTPLALHALLRDLPRSWVLGNEGEGTWNVFEVIAHLNHCERSDWMARIRIILQFGESRTFDALDRTAHMGEAREESLPQLLDEFAQLRSDNLIALRRLGLGPSQLHLRGNHPAFGAVALSQLLAAWVVHDLTHLHQISRILAHQYHGAVGPWSAYLGVLQCGGHSS